MSEHIAENLSLRVNGIEYTHIGLQYGIKSGFPAGPPELVIRDPLFGPITLTNECRLELKDEANGEWKPVSLRFLVTLLESFRP